MSNFIDLTGKRFGKLLVMSFIERKNHHTYWRCQCDCGKTTTARSNDLKSGKRISCGCAHITHGMTNTPTWKSWQSMKARCYDKNHEYYKYYGGRGITVCDRWRESFENFLEDMRERPSGMTLDRIDSNKEYFKENCKWSTTKEQNRNKRSNILLTYNNETKTLAQWAKELNMGYMKLWHRIKNGWPIERALGE